MRAATNILHKTIRIIIISIHAAHEGCDVISQKVKIKRTISIHAAHEGCDMQGRKLEDHSANISIHAAHEGCDTFARAAVNNA